MDFLKKRIANCGGAPGHCPEPRREVLYRGSEDAALRDRSKGGDQQVVGHHRGDKFGKIHFYTKHRTQRAMHGAEFPPDVREEIRGEFDHYLTVEVMLDAVALNPATEVAIQGLFLVSARGGDAIIN
jgi:hypothetical protein